MRHAYPQFVERSAEVVVVGPESPASFRAYFDREALPFVGLPDPEHSVLKLYGQEVSIFKLGRMPAQVLVDDAGIARIMHYGHSMNDIPPPEEMLAVLDGLQGEDTPR